MDRFPRCRTMSRFARLETLAVRSSYCMKTRLSTRGQIVLPEAIRRRLGLEPGDEFEASVREGEIVLTPQTPHPREARIVTDPLTGFPVIDLGPDAARVTTEMVRKLLEDFP